MQTIQTFVMDYVDEYVGEYNFVVYFFFVVVVGGFLHVRWPLHNCIRTEIISADNFCI